MLNKLLNLLPYYRRQRREALIVIRLLHGEPGTNEFYLSLVDSGLAQKLSPDRLLKIQPYDIDKFDAALLETLVEYYIKQSCTTKN